MVILIRFCLLNGNWSRNSSIFNISVLILMTYSFKRHHSSFYKIRLSKKAKLLKEKKKKSFFHQRYLAAGGPRLKENYLTNLNEFLTTNIFCKPHKFQLWAVFLQFLNRRQHNANLSRNTKGCLIVELGEYQNRLSSVNQESL